MSSLVDGIKSKAAQRKTRTVKIKVQLDNQTAQELMFIIENYKKIVGVDSGDYFAELFVEPKKKTISQLYAEFKKELDKLNKKDEEITQ